MKFFLPALMLTFPVLGQAEETSLARDVISAYAKTASTYYAQAANGARVFQTRVNEFLAQPSEQSLAAARTQWVEMRKWYSPTEIYRFYGSPIDGEGGPEGLLNSWPLDEAYIDYVVGSPGAGIINDVIHIPLINKEVLESLNEKEGEKSISVGFHAIEFLLWGQDLSATGPGNRPFTDYVVGKGKNANRRRDYLRAATELLVEKLAWVSQQWDQTREDSYGTAFAKEDSAEALRRMLTGIHFMAAEELSQERMFVAYDTQSQEDEHSCFSDTTHLDLRYNLVGIRNVLLGVGAPGVITLVAAKDAALAAELTAQLDKTTASMSAIPGAFDNAIYSEEGRAAILATVQNLEDLAAVIKRAGSALGIEIQ